MLAARGYLHWDVFYWFSGIGGRLLLKIPPTVSFVSFSNQRNARLCLILHVICGVLRVAGCQDFCCAFIFHCFVPIHLLWSHCSSDASVVMVWAQWERWNCMGSASQPWNERAGIWGNELRRARRTVTAKSGSSPKQFSHSVVYICQTQTDKAGAGISWQAKKAELVKTIYDLFLSFCWVSMCDPVQRGGHPRSSSHILTLSRQKELEEVLFWLPRKPQWIWFWGCRKE